MVLVKSYNPKRDETFEQLIERGLTSYEYSESRNGRLHASDTLCSLKSVYYSNKQGDEKETPDKYHFIQGGIGSEKVTVYSLSQTHSLLFDEYKMPDIGINLGGRCDAVLWFKDRLYIAEFKQIGTIPAHPVKEHESQSMIYSAITGLPVILYYVKRNVVGSKFPNEFEHKAFLLDSTYENRFKYLSRAVKSYLYNKENLLPSKPMYMEYKSWCPNYCELKEHCWASRGFPSNEGLEGFVFATPEQEQNIEERGDELTKQLMNKEVMKDRFTGVLNFIQNKSRHKIAKSVLGTSDWDEFFVY